MQNGTKQSTQIRHKAIYNRFKELTSECRNSGRYNNLYLTSFYLQIGEEMGYSDNYVCRIVCKLQREESARR